MFEAEILEMSMTVRELLWSFILLYVTIKLSRVTVIIRTRQKCSIKAIFVAFAVAMLE